MLRQRISWLSLVSLLVWVACVFLPRDAAHAQYDPSLSVESHAAYSLRPDQGRLSVAIQLFVTRPEGSSKAVDSIDVPVLPGASEIHAPTDDGRLLDVRITQRPGKPIARATVSFGHALEPGEQISFLLNYYLTFVSSDRVVVSDTYLYLPIVTIGDRADVLVDLPQDFAWYGVAQPYGCEKTASYPQWKFACSGSHDMYVAAVVELINESQYRTVLATSQVQGGTQPLDIRFLASETAWGLHVRDVAVAGIPVLESIVGVPLEISEGLVLLRVVREEIGGYDGLFQCEAKLCRIGVVPYADDHVVLHELSHLWTTNFESRWLAEGMAEFVSTHAVKQLGLHEDPPFDAPALSQPLYLDDWGMVSLDNLLTPEQQLAVELTGYRESLRFFQDLEDKIGLENIQKANVAAAALVSVNSQQYFDLLEQASGVDLSDMFLGRVFPPTYAPLLERRSRAQDTPESTKAAGGELPNAAAGSSAVPADPAGHRRLIALGALVLTGALMAYGAWWLGSRRGGATAPG